MTRFCKIERMQVLRLVVYCLLSVFFHGNTAFADSIDWPTLGFTQAVANTFSHPTVITHAGDNSGRVFIVEQAGRIRIVQSNNVLAQPFLDISSRVLSTGAEQGLLGLVFPSGFSTNHHFYVDYIRQTDGAIVISRFFLTTTNSNVADTNSEQIIKVIPKPSPPTTYNNHNGGQLAFGPDGYLYIGVGDGGSEGDPQLNGQKTKTLLGKLLRIDVESGVSPYDIPTNNPFVGNLNYTPEIWALGLRNPWRFSFDRQTGDLYIGDVGQYRFEEVDFQPASSTGGQNYGWRIVEGPTNYNVPTGFTNFLTLTGPVVWYDHLALPTDFAGSITGGYVYRGPSTPRMDGIYFYGDFMAGWIWGLKQVGTNWQSYPLWTPSPPPSHFMISTFGEDDQGQIYMADYYAGKIYLIQDTLNVWAPTFFPTNGIISSNMVTVRCVTTGAVIHYTSNGIDPTASDPVVASDGTLQVTSGLTNKLRAFRADLAASSVTKAIFTNKVATPIFSPPASAVTNGTFVGISTITPGASIYYTTNGANPTTGSLLYSTPIAITQGMTLKALGVVSGYSNSLIATASYSITLTPMPIFSPASGPITNGASITFTCATPGSTIYYTVDGSTPTTNSTVYSLPVTINGDTTLNSFAVANAYADSGVQSVFYQLVQTATPIFTPASGPITNETRIVITCSTTGSTIYYTVDGSTPTTNSLIFSTPIIINGGTTLNAYATADQHHDSTVQSTFYQLVQTATPIFIPSSGPVTYGTSVSISCATPASTIYYTLDGSIPTTNSQIYSSSMVVNCDTNLSAFATAPEHLDSLIQKNFYTLTQVAVPTFSPVQGLLTNGALISISTITSNSIIYYTTDGSDPNTSFNAFIYSNPLSFTNAMTLTARAYRGDMDPSGSRTVFFGLMDYEDTVVTTFAGGTTAGFSNAVGTLARFSNPEGVCVDKFGNVYVADAGNNVVRKILPTGQVTTFAGTGIAGSQLGQATNAQFSSPSDVCIDDAGNVYVADQGNGRVCKIGTNNMVVALASPSTGNLWQMAVDSAGNVYVGSSGTVQKIFPNGSVVGMAGNMNFICSGGWCVYVGPGVDNSTNIYAATEYKVWKITQDGTTELYAGSSQGYSDGSLSKAYFAGPEQTCFDYATNMFVSDQTRIRKISPAGWVSTMAGTGILGYLNGTGANAQFNEAFGLCVDTNGNIYVADSGNNCIREISPDSSGIGIPDWWQLVHFNHIGIDPNADLDHDGMSNYQEFWAGTDPLDPKSYFAIKSLVVMVGGFAQISWQSVSGKTYTVQYSDDLKTWNSLSGSTVGSGSIISVSDTTSIQQAPHRMYRVYLVF